MKTAHLSPPRPVTAPRDRRIAGHAQLDHVLDPYQGKKKLHDGTVCPQCGATYRDGRWQWLAGEEGAPTALCAACRRANDKFPAGIVRLGGRLSLEHREEMLRLARHQEEAEKKEHPLNRIMSIEADGDGVTIATTDIHLPRRIGEAIQRAFHGQLAAQFEEDGYFVRVTWTPAE
jgi:NMD protein affecting ribosome stability and mRNA decay